MKEENGCVYVQVSVCVTKLVDGATTLPEVKGWRRSGEQYRVARGCCTGDDGDRCRALKHCVGEDAGPCTNGRIGRGEVPASLLSLTGEPDLKSRRKAETALVSG
mmetsp:Transcript_39729/g.105190  ORF Transcript_39729/g.105190 Transcript_39729/m.105190 type:complete len:105 (+) Transcript_39729:988-1302(+)